MFSPSVEKLIKLFSKFPTVGPRTAARFVFYLLHIPEQEIENLIKALRNLKKNTKICPLCFNVFEPSRNEKLCNICSDPKRDKSQVAIVEKEVDLEAIEKIKKYQGIYFVLGGVITGFGNEEKISQVEKRIEKLITRIEKPDSEIQEIILALNPTVEGEATSLWLERKLKLFSKIKITRLARGLPQGGELEYADEETLANALRGRR